MSMSDQIHYECCPICGGQEWDAIFPVVDQLVSKQAFDIIECKRCGVRITQDAPGLSASGAFYASDAYVSHSNTNKGLINQLYQLVRKRTLSQKVTLIESCTGLKGGRLLDVGSGTGAFVAALRHAGWRADGLEPDPTARQVAAKDFAITLMESDQLFKLPPGEFDAITLWHVLEHVHDLDGYMQAFRRLLKPGGRLLLALPNHTSFDANHFQRWWAAYDVPRHLYHFAPASIRHLAQRHGFECRSIRPMWYDAFYISLLSHQHKTGSSRWFSSFWIGMRSNWNALFNRERASSLIYELKPI